MNSSENKSMSNMTDDEKENALLDETLQLLSAYDDGCTPRDMKGFSDCSCCSHDDVAAAPKMKE